MTVITRRGSDDASQPETSTRSQTDARKRHVEDVYDDAEPRAKKMRPIVIDVDAEDSDNDDDAVEQMIIDTSMPGAWKDKSAQRDRRRDKMRQRWKHRAEAVTSTNEHDSPEIVDLSMIDLTIDEPSTQSNNTNSINSQNSTSSSYPHSSPNYTAYSTQGSSGSTAFSSNSQPSSFSFFPFHFKRPVDLTGDELVIAAKRARTKSPPRPVFKRMKPNKRAEFVRNRNDRQKMAAAKAQARSREFEESIRASAADAFSRASSQSNGKQHKCH